MGNSSSTTYELGESIGQSLGNIMILVWIILIAVCVLSIALLVWFIWTMCRIKQECVRTNKLLSDLNKNIRTLQGARQAPAADLSVSDELAKYKALLDGGAISEDEYNLKKAQLLSMPQYK